MSLGKGINSHVGYGAEVTYGVKGAIDLFNCIVSESLRHIKDPFMSESLKADWHDDVYYSALFPMIEAIIETLPRRRGN